MGRCRDVLCLARFIQRGNKGTEEKTLKLGMRLISSWLYRYPVKNCVDYEASRWVEIEFSLRWYLTDKEAVLEFKDEFDKLYGFKNEEENITEERKIIWDKFYVMVEKLLYDLDVEEKKRKAPNEILGLPNKRCT